MQNAANRVCTATSPAQSMEKEISDLQEQLKAAKVWRAGRIHHQKKLPRDDISNVSNVWNMLMDNNG